jgi:phosphoglycolate phosphatase
MSTKLLIFDLDGTLIDSLADLADATNHIRAAHSLPPLSLDGVRALVGQGARSLVNRALPGASEPEVERALEAFLAFNLEHIVDKTRPYPGVAETLETLVNRGIQLCVLSNKNVALCRDVMQRLDIARFVPAIFGADSFPFRKPSPEPVRALLAQYGVTAGECVLVGDSINDIQKLLDLPIF